MDSITQAAWIEFFGTVTAALVAGIIGVRWLNQQKIEQQLKEVKADIRFLLEVESISAEWKTPDKLLSALRKNRSEAKLRGFCWSGKNTKSRVVQGGP